MGNWKIIVNGNTQDLDTNYSFKVQQMIGSGMPPLNNISTSFGLLDGALFQRTRVDARSFTLVGYINGGSSVAELHGKRSDLIDAFKPDRSASPQPVVLQYTGGASTLQASAFLESGLELNNISVNDELNMALRLVSYDPYWEKATSTSATLTVQTTFSASRVAQRAASGGWSTLSTGLGGVVNAIVASGDGPVLVFGGNFTTAGGATACRVAQWSGAAWSKVGNAMSGQVNTLVFDRSRELLIAGGFFNTASGFTANSIAKWSGTAWTSMSSGMDATVKTLLAHSSGSIIAGGGFTTAGGTAASFIARWSHTASTWTAMSTGMHAPLPGDNGTVNNLAEMRNGDIVAVGAFNNAGGTSSSGAALWTGSSWAGMSTSGLNGDGNSATVTSDGTLFVGAGVGAASHLNSWNGAAWKGYQNITNDAVLSSVLDPFTGNLYIAGPFTKINSSIPVSTGLARLIGTTTTIVPDIQLGAVNVSALHAASTGVLTLGLSDIVTASAAAVTAITNGGTAATYPILTACAPTTASARLSQLVNYTTGEAIYFNLAMLPAEIVTLDLRPGQKTLISSIRGNIINTVLPGSNVSTWRLMPGTNNVSVWLSGGSGGAKLVWTERFWSLDG